MGLYSKKNKRRLDGKVAVITGASSGIGFETAKDLSKRGAKVLMLCRDTERQAAKTKKEIVEETHGKVDVYKLDLSSLKSVRECAKQIKLKEDKVHFLVNNAGVAMCPHWTTEDGFEMHFGTNHLGHFLLTELLTPLLKNAALENHEFRPRIVIVSSIMHRMVQMRWDDLQWTKEYSKSKAYAQSKLANVLHAQELAQRLEKDGISVYSLHPGAVDTSASRHLKKKYWYLRPMAPVFEAMLKTPLQGAQTTLYCCLEESIASDSGKYYDGCKEKPVGSQAKETGAQSRLWKMSEELVGLNAK